MVERQYCKQMSIWAGFVGIMSMIGGSIWILVGIWYLGIGAIPGVFMVILGLFLWRAKKLADELYALPRGKEKDSVQVMNLLFVNLNAYFKLLGALIIVILVAAFLLIISGALKDLAPNLFNGFKLF